jgi:hypothetical protein
MAMKFGYALRGETAKAHLVGGTKAVRERLRCVRVVTGADDAVERM